MCIAGLLFYDYLTELLWDTVNDLGYGMQKVAIGNTDQFFVFTHIKTTLSRLMGLDWDLFDKGGKIGAAIGFSFFTFLLNIGVTIASAWSAVGYMFCKLIGFIFIPFAAWRHTSDYLNKMFSLMLGFVLFAFFVRVACILILILFEVYIFGAFTLGGVQEPKIIQITLQNCSELTAVTLVAFFFILGAGKLSQHLASASLGKSNGFGHLLRIMKFLKG
ncbi:hypothetical protein [Zooshikella ganghwensis]|uniref:hypothetical protein n=1 Tax=Zooshikella ganghwensis TaxID=202772 RepID=UPI0010591F03|nr:hypothetical protein [Zooshikella ganghwensis]